MIHKSGIISGVRVHDKSQWGGHPLPPYATDLQFQISSHDVWRPGVFDSERAARYAFRFDDGELQALQDKVNAEHSDPERRVITYDMLRDLRKSTA